MYIVLNFKRPANKSNNQWTDNEVHFYLINSICFKCRSSSLQSSSAYFDYFLWQTSRGLGGCIFLTGWAWLSLRIVQKASPTVRLVLQKLTAFYYLLLFIYFHTKYSCMKSRLSNLVISVSSFPLFCQCKVKILKHHKLTHINYERIKELIPFSAHW